MAHSPAASTAIYSQNVAPSYVRLEINVLTRGRIGSQGHELEFWLQERLLYRVITYRIITLGFLAFSTQDFA